MQNIVLESVEIELGRENSIITKNKTYPNNWATSVRLIQCLQFFPFK